MELLISTRNNAQPHLLRDVRLIIHEEFFFYGIITINSGLIKILDFFITKKN